MFSDNNSSAFDDPTPIETVEVVYICKNEHRTPITFTFSDKTEIPNEWDCKFCGEIAVKEGSEIEAKKKKSRKKYANDENPAYTMLRERYKGDKGEAELRADLEEQLKLLRSGKLKKASNMS